MSVSAKTLENINTAEMLTNISPTMLDKLNKIKKLLEYLLKF